MSSNPIISDPTGLSDWPTPPAWPVEIIDCGGYRDGGPQGGTYSVILRDAAGTTFRIFFDRFLGRLCYGTHDREDDAAFIRKGSRLESEAFAAIEAALAPHPEEREHLAERLRIARRWKGVGQG